MKHRTLIKVHGYIAVFFLPFAILYASTGALYIAGEKGETSVTTLSVSLDDGWPMRASVALDLATRHLLLNQLPHASSSAGAFIGENEFRWRGLTHIVSLVRISDSEASIVFQKNSVYKQIVEIHKNHAGGFFAFAGFAFGLGMIILVMSGAYMMFQSRIYRKAATVLLSGGTTFILLTYLVATST